MFKFPEVKPGDYIQLKTWDEVYEWMQQVYAADRPPMGFDQLLLHDTSRGGEPSWMLRDNMHDTFYHLCPAQKDILGKIFKVDSIADPGNVLVSTDCFGSVVSKHLIKEVVDKPFERILTRRSTRKYKQPPVWFRRLKVFHPSAIPGVTHFDAEDSSTYEKDSEGNVKSIGKQY